MFTHAYVYSKFLMGEIPLVFLLLPDSLGKYLSVFLFTGRTYFNFVLLSEKHYLYNQGNCEWKNL